MKTKLLLLLISLVLFTGCSNETKANETKAEMSDSDYCKSFEKYYKDYYDGNKRFKTCKVIDLIKAPGRYNKLVADVFVEERAEASSPWFDYKTVRLKAKVNKENGETVDFGIRLRDWW